MKRHFKKLLFLLAATLMLSAIHVSVYAAITPMGDESPTPTPTPTPTPDPTPAPVIPKVTGMKVVLSESTATIYWNKINDFSLWYVLYQYDPATKKSTRIGATRLASAVVKNLAHNKSYSYYVCACDNDQKYYGPKSSLLTFKNYKVNVPAPKKFRVRGTSGTTVSFTWTPAAAAQISGQQIFEYDEYNRKYLPVGNLLKKKLNNASFTKLIRGQTYRYQIRSYRVVNGTRIYSKASGVEIVKIPISFSAEKKVRRPRYKVTAKTNIVAKDLKTGKSFTIKKGTKLTVADIYHGKTTTAYLSNGKTATVAISKVSAYGLDCSPNKDYSKAVKEQFVNGHNFSSNSKYFIWLSEFKLKVNIFQGSRGKWKLVKSYPCVVGAYNHRTSDGYRTILKKKAHGKYGTPYFYFSHGPNATKDNPNGCAFHQYVDKSRNVAISHGCVRVPMDCLNWMYKYIAEGTAVYVY